jgi:hypothetical protein
MSVPRLIIKIRATYISRSSLRHSCNVNLAAILAIDYSRNFTGQLVFKKN